MRPLSTLTSKESIAETQASTPNLQDLGQVKIKSTSGFYDDFVVDITQDGKCLSLEAQHNGKTLLFPIRKFSLQSCVTETEATATADNESACLFGVTLTMTTLETIRVYFTEFSELNKLMRKVHFK